MAEHIGARPCSDLEADLVLLHYGDLADNECQRLQNHAASCACCTAYLQELAGLLPLAIETDTPSEQFWMDYNRELRHKLDAALEKKSWWGGVASWFTPRYLPAFAGAAVVVLALTFTLGNGLWSGKNGTADDEMTEVLPVAENLEFFHALDVLDELDVLESMDGNSAA